MTPFSETRRQIVHMSMGGFALLLRVLTWWQAALLAAVALAFNATVLPRLLAGRAIFRPAEVARGVPLGILLYPLAVLSLILAFPTRLDFAAAAWGILAAGDGAATLAGRALNTRPLPWNRNKTIGGTLTFLGAGATAGVLLAAWVRPAVSPMPPLSFTLVAPVVAAAAAALVETIPVRLDDNISVPAAAGSVLWAAGLVSEQAWAAAWPDVSAALLPAVLVNAVMGALAWRARTVSISGAAGGALLGAVIYACTGLGGWLLLFATFGSAAASSRLGLRRKVLLGIAEDRGGRRAFGNALANCGLAVAAALIAVTTPYQTTALLALVAALSAAGSDTVASEIGKAWGRHTFLVTGFRRVQPGTSGAVSLEGTAAGLVSALALAALGQAAGLIPSSYIWSVVVGATIGSLVESALGATLEAPGILNNDLLNFLNTAVATICAIWLVGLIS